MADVKTESPAPREKLEAQIKSADMVRICPVQSATPSRNR
jgi:hypothetical protein